MKKIFKKTIIYNIILEFRFLLNPQQILMLNGWQGLGSASQSEAHWQPLALGNAHAAPHQGKLRRSDVEAARHGTERRGGAGIESS